MFDYCDMPQRVQDRKRRLRIGHDSIALGEDTCIHGNGSVLDGIFCKLAETTQEVDVRGLVSAAVVNLGPTCWFRV
jgi:hypothetical protein